MNFIFWQMSLFLPRLLCILEHWLWSNLKEGTWNIWWIEIMLVRLVKLAFRGKKTRWKIVRKEASHTWNLFYLLCQEKRRKGKKRKGKGKKKERKSSNISFQSIPWSDSFPLVAVSGKFFRNSYLFYNLFLKSHLWGYWFLL